MSLRQDWLEQWASSHETDEAIAEAIFYLTKDEREAEQIWKDPTYREALSVWERATNNGARPQEIGPDTMYWGASTLTEVMESFAELQETEASMLYAIELNEGL